MPHASTTAKYIVLYDGECLEGDTIFTSLSEALAMIKEESADNDNNPEDYSIAFVSEIKDVEMKLQLIPAVK